MVHLREGQPATATSSNSFRPRSSLEAGGEAEKAASVAVPLVPVQKPEDTFTTRAVRGALRPMAKLGAVVLRQGIAKEVRKSQAELRAHGGEKVEIDHVGLPGVSKIRPEEELDFLRFRSPLYVKPMTEGVVKQFARYLTGKQRLPEASDAQIVQMLLGTAISHSLVRTPSADGERFVLDLSQQLQLRTFSRSTFAVRRASIPVDPARRGELEIEMSDGKTYRPGDADWTRAKLFFQVSWSHAITGMVHTWVHFALPEVSAAVLENEVPRGSNLDKLLAPHLRFTMRINHQALRIGRFSSNEETGLRAKVTPWLSLPMDREAFTGLIEERVKEHYLHAPEVGSVFPPRFDEAKPYDRFLSAHYRVVRDFVEKVWPLIEPEDYAAWAGKLSEFIPDVKNTSPIDMLASLIWQVSVLHSTDHVSSFDLCDYAVPRATAPFNSDRARKAMKPHRDLVAGYDLYKWRTAKDTFIQNLPQHPEVENRTGAAEYGEVPDAFKAAASEFQGELRRLDGEFEAEGQRFCPLDKMLQSICY